MGRVGGEETESNSTAGCRGGPIYAYALHVAHYLRLLLPSPTSDNPTILNDSERS